MLKVLVIVISCIHSTVALALEFVSNATQSTVIELYTSEGCSSCPPADKWLGQYVSDPNVFNRVIPMAFHVDYWDYLGWQDVFAQKVYSQRQRWLSEQGILKSVYTPAFVVNSKEWRGWFTTNKTLPHINDSHSPGVLRCQLMDNHLMVTFPSDQHLVLNIAYLGMGLQSQVTAGENRRRTLKHDFVVLKHWQVHAANAMGDLAMWDVVAQAVPKKGQRQTAIVVWVTKKNSANILQAAASFL